MATHRGNGSAPARCGPYPEGGARTDCPAGQAHFPGEPGCAAVDGPCPADAWPEATTERTLHVRAGAPPGGDGSRDAPVGTIAQALARAGEGTVVAVAAGDYDEVVRIRAGVTLRGACAARTRIVPSAPSESEAAVEVTGMGAAIERISIESSARGGIRVDGSAGATSLAIRGVVVRSARPFGVAARGARARGRSRPGLAVGRA